MKWHTTLFAGLLGAGLVPLMANACLIPAGTSGASVEAAAAALNPLFAAGLAGGTTSTPTPEQMSAFGAATAGSYSMGKIIRDQPVIISPKLTIRANFCCKIILFTSGRRFQKVLFRVSYRPGIVCDQAVNYSMVNK